MRSIVVWQPLVAFSIGWILPFPADVGAVREQPSQPREIEGVETKRANSARIFILGPLLLVLRWFIWRCAESEIVHTRQHRL